MKKAVDGNWFETDTAEQWNLLDDSVASSTTKEVLWRTKAGTFIHERDDRSFGYTIRAVEDDEALRLLTTGGHDLPDDLVPGDEL